MNEYLLLTILLTHFIADFIFQTHWEAINKSSNNEALLSHTSKYAAFWVIPAAIFISDPINAALFVIITFVLHTLTDYFTSRWVKKLFDKKDYHNGFVVIDIDQMLHYFQLYFTFKLLI